MTDPLQTTNVRLKLLIDTESRSVLYGEADKDFIDFLFNLLSLPLGAVIRLLTKEHMIGCLGNLYESVETLNETCFVQPSQTKEALLRPKVSLNCSSKLLPCTIQTSSSSNIGGASYSSTSSYSCSSSLSVSSSTSTYSCNSGLFATRSSSTSTSSFNLGSPSSTSRNTSTFSYIPSPSPAPLNTWGCLSLGRISDEPLLGDRLSTQTTSGSTRCHDGSDELKVGFVKGLATYIVMDDLTVKHISEFSIVSLFKKLNIKDADALEEKVITLNVDEGVELLKASLQSNMVLTDVFLRRDRERQIIDNYNDNNGT